MDQGLLSLSHITMIFVVTYNYGYKIRKHFKTLLWFDSLQVKWYMKSGAKSIVYELPHELPNDLRLRILGN